MFFSGTKIRGGTYDSARFIRIRYTVYKTKKRKTNSMTKNNNKIKINKIFLED